MEQFEVKQGTFFVCKVKAVEVQEDGMAKKVSKQYAIEALTCGECEKRTYEELSPFYKDGEMEIVAMKNADFKEVYFSSDEAADKWYICKLQYITLDEYRGKEIKTTEKLLLQAASLDKANAMVNSIMESSVCDYVKVEIKDSNIFDVIKNAD